MSWWPGIGQALAGASLGYVTVSLAESFLHRNAQHANRKIRAAAKRLGRFAPMLMRIYVSHAIVHHGKTFRQSHVQLFRDRQEKEALDRWILTTQGNRLIIDEQYGLTLHRWGVLAFILPVLPLFSLYVLLLPMTAALGALVFLVIYPLSSMLLHPYLHMTRAEALARASWPMRLCLQSRYVRFISRHHFLHHRYVHCNYNLLWLGDFLLGRHRSPSEKDRADMRGLGMIQ